MEVHDPFTVYFTNESSFFSTNTLYSFRSIINPPIWLPFKEWEVGLSKVIIPQTRQVWTPSSEIEVTIRIAGLVEPLLVRIQFTERIYDSLDALIGWVEDHIHNQLADIYIRQPHLFNISIGRLPGVGFSLSKEGARLRFSSVNLFALRDDSIHVSSVVVINGLELWHILGFREMHLNREYILPIDATTTPTFVVEASTLSMFAPNLIVELFVGDQLKPLLEMIPYNINSRLDSMVFEQRYPLYKTIFGGYINNIHIELTDVNENPVFFESGKLQIVLHFRPCQTMIKR